MDEITRNVWNANANEKSKTPLGGLLIEREVRQGGGRYETTIDGYAGVLVYQDTIVDGELTRTATSTRVAKELSGGGIGLELVRRMVADARIEHAKIDPRCSFVRVMMARNKDWQDVLVEETEA